jgi:hypothetical protein
MGVVFFVDISPDDDPGLSHPVLDEDWTALSFGGGLVP